MPVLRQSAYGVGVPGLSVTSGAVYRQVLPPAPAAAARMTSPAYQGPPAAPSLTMTSSLTSSMTSSSQTKDEREGPEGASSSPGLASDVSM